MMKVAGSFRFVTYAALSLLLVIFTGVGDGRNTSCTTPSLLPPNGSASWGDYVKFINAPSRVIDGYDLSVRYLCTRPCVVGVDVVAPSEWRSGPLVFQRTWTSVPGPQGAARRHSLRLRFPAAMAYQRDFFIRSPIDTHDMILRAWLDHVERPNGSVGGLDSYHGALVQTFLVLEVLPPSERPVKQHRTCLSWGAELMWILSRDKGGWCPRESDTIDLLTFPLASTGERFGAIRQFKPFLNEDLEDIRSRLVEEPRLALSVWIYLLNWCNRQLCGILQHVNSDNQFDTPLVLLANKGDVIFQVRLVSGEDRGFRAHTGLALRVWHRLDFFVEASKVICKIFPFCMNKWIMFFSLMWYVSQVTLQVMSLVTAAEMVRKEYAYVFRGDVHYNDTAGHFVIGGGKFMPGFQGYLGPIRYHRLGAEEIVNPLSPVSAALALDQTHRTCEEIRAAVGDFLQALGDTKEDHRTSRSFHADLRLRYGRKTCKAPSIEPGPLHHCLQQMLKDVDQNLMAGSWDRNVMQDFGRWLFEDVQDRLSWGSVATVTPVLQLSSCLGHSQASLLLAAVYLAGFGVPVDTLQGHVYSLMGAQADHRLALMHLGYKHALGIDGFPQDHDMAYGYYSNLGKQSCADRWQTQATEQYITEHILLADEAGLRAHADDRDDIFHFIKFQAERGDLESQKALARMLFWGEQGVPKDMKAALRWYARSAMRLTDARAMYDYSILLLKGQGVKKNTTLGRELMEKAASMGLPEAINGMGWYYSTFMADTETAVRYFERAAQNGSRDAVYNLGLFYLSGSYPGKPGKNQSMAFEHFLNASLKGHADASVEAAWYYATGILQSVDRAPEKAVVLLKRICEQNGYLGSILRKGLNAYLRGSREKALLSYLLAAETGLDSAQSNAAHLCEELGDSQGYGCAWRYYNHSTYNYSPHSSVFLKVGDFYYYGQHNQTQNISLAMWMYARAAFAGSPQGIFNLAVMFEAGHDIPQKVQEKFRITKQDQLDRSAVLEKLYQSCRRLEPEEDLSPCSLALLTIQLRSACWSLTHSSTKSLLVCVIGVAAVVALLIILTECSPLRVNTAATGHHGDNRSSTDSVNRAWAQGAGTPAAAQEVTNGNGWMGVAMWSVHERDVQRVADWAWSVLGTCLCAMGSILLSQML
ncbi:protein sel-1 homolog 3 [Scleropages formosus]|uniref:protein sel-1 homolog 3 n=1 Tax=Scleropages formosus TaxID=113540 RepID=UPI0010FA750C|nr:protein sel-1 homolog 3 [Scleropages formosus]